MRQNIEFEFLENTIKLQSYQSQTRFIQFANEIKSIQNGKQTLNQFCVCADMMSLFSFNYWSKQN